LNLVGGNIRSQSLSDIYRSSDVFTRVRDYAQLKGKCGLCEFKSICGGSRSRAYAITGDPMRSDPYCVYQPVRKERINANGKSRPSAEAVARPLCA
jgi:MoaA/NifB/PqqE/SkfB family radical SAM enzyme